MLIAAILNKLPGIGNYYVCKFYQLPWNVGKLFNGCKRKISVTYIESNDYVMLNTSTPPISLL